MRTASLLAAAVSLAAGLTVGRAEAQSIERVSVDSFGAQSDGLSQWAFVSGDGGHVAFMSEASNLVPGDTNGARDVFVRDRLTGVTSRVSVSSSGTQAIGHSGLNGMSISASGRYVTFTSTAMNLVTGDRNLSNDVFVHDRHQARTWRTSVNDRGEEGNGDSLWPSISADGRFVAFDSKANNLVPGDLNGWSDVFVHDRATGRTSLVSVDSAGIQGDGNSIKPFLSASGRFVVFSSLSTNFMAADTNRAYDIFVHDRQTGLTENVNVNEWGVQSDFQSGSYALSISADGRHVAFDSNATNLVPNDSNRRWDVYVHDRLTRRTSRVSLNLAGQQWDNHHSYAPSISPDGRYVTFFSSFNVYLRDRLLERTELISADPAGTPGDDVSTYPTLSADGRHVAFVSSATNLVPGDTNDAMDVFILDRGPLAPGLAKTGICPGPITLDVRDASALGRILILHGPSGSFVNPSQPCQGLLLGLSSPHLGALVTADASGHANVIFTPPPGSCGRRIQAVDLASCVATNVIVL